MHLSAHYTHTHTYVCIVYCIQFKQLLLLCFLTHLCWKLHGLVRES